LSCGFLRSPDGQPLIEIQSEALPSADKRTNRGRAARTAPTSDMSFMIKKTAQIGRVVVWFVGHFVGRTNSP
jgi:hypothetical protein